MIIYYDVTMLFSNKIVSIMFILCLFTYMYSYKNHLATEIRIFVFLKFVAFVKFDKLYFLCMWYC
jgi:hypothetical protein